MIDVKYVDTELEINVESKHGSNRQGSTIRILLC